MWRSAVPRSKRALAAAVLLALSAGPLRAAEPAARPASALFGRPNLVAWCIVPFDAKQRGPAERAGMLQRLGFTKVAYDWRDEHVPSFEQEILEYQKHGLEYFSFWGLHDEAFRLFAKHGLHPQIWLMPPNPSEGSHEERVRQAVAELLPAVERTRKAGLKLGLYNHGGWGGEPENLVAVCEALRSEHGADHVGIVYNLHHGHDHVERFPQALAAMKPYLFCVNLNGMTADGERRGKKILPLGQGEHDLDLLKTIVASGYEGPIGIIGHTQDDVEQRLLDNLEGLDWLVSQLQGDKPGTKPKLRTAP
ncbi:MAG: TIM barrel protein [Pirellulales bacterium]